MEIILNEKEWCEDAINSMYLGKKPTETLGRLARYFFSLGYKKNDIVTSLEQHLLRCDNSVNVVQWRQTLDSMAKRADKYPLVNISDIPVTAAQMDRIHEQGSVLKEKLLFTLLCLAKYGNMKNPKNNGWVNIDHRSIFPLANITIGIKRQQQLLNELLQSGVIAMSCIVDNVNIRVCIIDDAGDASLRVTDFRSLGNQYMMSILPTDYITCESCGVVIKRSNNRHKYCKDCSVQVNISKVIQKRSMKADT